MVALLSNTDDEPLKPDQARMIKRVKWLMLLSGFATILGIVVVLILAGYRLFHTPAPSGGASAELTALLPKGARIVATTTAGDAVIVTIEAGGATEIRSFDAKTLRPQARLRFLTEP
jgi:hypothetical protein